MGNFDTFTSVSSLFIFIHCHPLHKESILQYPSKQHIKILTKSNFDVLETKIVLLNFCGNLFETKLAEEKDKETRF